MTDDVSLSLSLIYDVIDCVDNITTPVISSDNPVESGGLVELFIPVGDRTEAFIDSLSVATKLGDTVSLYIMLRVDQCAALGRLDLLKEK